MSRQSDVQPPQCEGYVSSLGQTRRASKGLFRDIDKDFLKVEERGSLEPEQWLSVI